MHCEPGAIRERVVMMELLFYLLTALPYLIAAGLGLALPMLLLGIYRHFSAGLVLICLTVVLDAVSLSQPVLRVGITLYPPDVPLMLVAGAAGMRWILREDVRRPPWAWLVLVLIFSVSLGLGLMRHGTAAGVQARGDFYAIAVASYAMSFPIAAREMRQLVIAFTSTAAALIVLTSYRWTVYYGDFRDLLPAGGSYNYDGPIRVIGANLTLLMAQVLVLGLFFGSARIGARGAQWLSLVVLAVVLALQHRSVWLALLAGVMLSLLVARAQRAPLWQQLLLSLTVACTAAAPVLINDGLSSQIRSSASTALAGSGTVDARFENWKATLEKWHADGPRAVALGRLPGSDTTRTIVTESGERREITFSAHNHYIGTLTGLGVVGLLTMLSVFGGALFGLWRLSNRSEVRSPESAVLLVLIGMQLIYYVAYGVDYMQYLVLGMAVSWVAGQRSLKVERSPAHSMSTLNGRTAPA